MRSIEYRVNMAHLGQRMCAYSAGSHYSVSFDVSQLRFSPVAAASAPRLDVGLLDGVSYCRWRLCIASVLARRSGRLQPNDNDVSHDGGTALAGEDAPPCTWHLVTRCAVGSSAHAQHDGHGQASGQRVALVTFGCCGHLIRRGAYTWLHTCRSTLCDGVGDLGRNLI